MFLNLDFWYINWGRLFDIYYIIFNINHCLVPRKAVHERIVCLKKKLGESFQEQKVAKGYNSQYKENSQ